MVRLIKVLLPAIFAAVGFSCQQQSELSPSGKLKVTATTGMIADAAAKVGGEFVEVSALMGPGVDPHLYKATQGDLEKLSGAAIIFYNGLHLEGKMADVLVKLASRVPTAAVTENIPEDQLREPPEFAGQFDPHVWFDVALWKYAVESVRDHLVKVDPAHAEAYQANATAYLGELDALHQWAADQIATVPEDRRVLITAHDAFGYFGRAYNIEVQGIQGISTVSEYGLQDLERIVDQLVSRKIPAVFIESSISPRSIEALVAGAQAKGHTVKLGGTLYSDALGAADSEASSYVGMVRHNVRTIVEALK